MFVYNADGGVLNALRDTWLRLRSPQTYPCQLCKLTVGVRGMNPRWKRFLDSLDLPVVFMHRDEFRSAYAASSWRNVDLPVALLQSGRGLEVVVSAGQMRRATTAKELIASVRAGLETRRASA